MSKLTHKMLWNLGRSYAERVAPIVVEQAARQNCPLPIRNSQELYPALRDVYVLLEREHGIPWDSLTSGKQDDFLTGWWNRLREKGIYQVI